jgi:hypothetical protein
VAACRYLSFVYWGYSLLLKIQFHDKTYVDCGLLDPTNQQVQPGQSVRCEEIQNISETINLPRNADESPWPEIVILLGMLFLFRYSIYLVLRYKTRRA